MRIHRWQDIKRSRPGTEAEKRVAELVEEAKLELSLAELRNKLGLTQTELAEAAGFEQTAISKAEKRSDHLVSTLRQYVKGLGGELELTAVVKGKRIRLSGV